MHKHTALFNWEEEYSRNSQLILPDFLGPWEYHEFESFISTMDISKLHSG